MSASPFFFGQKHGLALIGLACRNDKIPDHPFTVLLFSSKLVQQLCLGASSRLLNHLCNSNVSSGYPGLLIWKSRLGRYFLLQSRNRHAPAQLEVDLDTQSPTYIVFPVVINDTESHVRLGFVPFDIDDCRFTYHRYTLHAAPSRPLSTVEFDNVKLDIAEAAQRTYEKLNFRSGKYAFKFCAEE